MHSSSEKLLRSWVQFPLDDGLFSSLSIPKLCVINKSPQGGATLMIFPSHK